MAARRHALALIRYGFVRGRRRVRGGVHRDRAQRPQAVGGDVKAVAGAASCQTTENEEPSLESAAGMAWIGGVAGVNRVDAGICPLWSSIGVAVQAGSESVPTCRAAFADAPENVTVPKFARRSTRQSPAALHDDGASAIHSADATSGFAILSFFA
jgi:hypothetical protein